MNLSTRYQFTGREFDNLTGLHYYRARWYDASVGRFISEDPIGFAGGDVNLYGYVGNTPTGFVDPSGLEAGWGTRKANMLDEYIEYAHNQYRYNDQEWFANGVNQSVADVAHGFADLLRVGNGVAQAYYCEDNIWGQAAFVMMDVGRISGIASIFLGAVAPKYSGPASWGTKSLFSKRGAAPPPPPPPPGSTPVHTGSGHAPKNSIPNSIYEQLDAGGKVRSRTFYDDNGYPFSRQDFDHSHNGLQPHEHRMGYDSSGRPNVKKETGPVPPGY